MIDVSERDLLTIQGLLEKYVPDCNVWAFGSRAAWTAKEHSDLDLVILGPSKLKTRIFESLKEDLDESALPFRVDILDWHRISSEFKRNIEKSHVVIKRVGKKSAQSRQYYKVSDFADVVGGGTPKTGVPEYWNGDIPWITPKDLSEHRERYVSRGERNITKEGLKNSAARIVPENTVLLTSRAPVGYLAIAQNPLTTNQGFRSLIIKEDFSAEFIYYLLVNNVEYLKQHASGSTFQELSGSTLKNLQFQIPSLLEQRAIAKILGGLDAKIELICQMNETLEHMARAIFKKWFVDFEFPGYEKTKFIDGMPEGWDIKPIGEILELAYGKALKEDNRRSGNIPVYGLNGQIGFHDEALVKGPGIVIGRKGNPGVVTWVPHEFFPIDTTFYVIPKGEVRSMYYLYFLLSSIDLASFGADSAVPGLNRNMAYGTDIIASSKEIIDKFDEQIKPLHDQKYQNEAESQILEQIRDTLLPKLMSGEIRARNKSCL